jgi:hypothetical protein
MAEELSNQEHFPISSVMAVVISELGWNIKRYAGRGSITLTTHLGESKYIQILARSGPGYLGRRASSGR